MLDSVTDGLGASTAIGTNVKGSSKQYGELPQKKIKQKLGGLQQRANFESSLDAYSNI